MTRGGGVGAYVVRRLVLVVPTLVGITILAFALASLAPGDPAAEYLRRVYGREPTPIELRDERRALGLDRPVVVQYLRWVSGAAHGDLGTSFATRQPVRRELLRRIPFTLELAVPAALLALVVAVPAGIVSAIHRNRVLDHVLRVGSLAGASMPSFWLALLLIILFAVHWSLVPVAGRGGLSGLVLPTVTLAVAPAAVLARFTRSAMLETLGEGYVVTARSKGLTQWFVVGRHAFRNALIPIVTAFTTSLGFLLSGVVVIETIFVWPGVGGLIIDAIQARDYPMIQGFVLYTGIAFLVINLVVDLLYLVIDPRVALTTEEAA
ncbi:MAG TPA: nickel ABC transporter permease [Acidimicrobiales bacterium]|nr:nickel ABC transporter permease [Acidimicrobiales bacterium]